MQLKIPEFRTPKAQVFSFRKPRTLNPMVPYAKQPEEKKITVVVFQTPNTQEDFQVYPDVQSLSSKGTNIQATKSQNFQTRS
ncbi:hypothetical protein HYALB_00006482 [Hymenoscyphus albidus]|uniref:Uncharacterized protein n=1 Tax=Hymenoscyphus albidus TaxID=595503 RepID=A0A9N9PZ37_9HELO|nr:hypothetical protein HYALB_00006482 [Hymenoscyphus albidus]